MRPWTVLRVLTIAVALTPPFPAFGSERVKIRIGGEFAPFRTFSGDFSAMNTAWLRETSGESLADAYRRLLSGTGFSMFFSVENSPQFTVYLLHTRTFAPGDHFLGAVRHDARTEHAGQPFAISADVALGDDIGIGLAYQSSRTVMRVRSEADFITIREAVRANVFCGNPPPVWWRIDLDRDFAIGEQETAVAFREFTVSLSYRTASVSWLFLNVHIGLATLFGEFQSEGKGKQYHYTVYNLEKSFPGLPPAMFRVPVADTEVARFAHVAVVRPWISAAFATPIFRGFHLQSAVRFSLPLGPREFTFSTPSVIEAFGEQRYTFPTSILGWTIGLGYEFD